MPASGKEMESVGGPRGWAQRSEGGVARSISGGGAGGDGGTPERTVGHPAFAAARMATVAGLAFAGCSCPRLLHHGSTGGEGATPSGRRCNGSRVHYSASAATTLEGDDEEGG